jgi:crotonobetainyl-CoA:carnitine CoA-transferase CaiB-like acyl-CoA transferase
METVRERSSRDGDADAGTPRPAGSGAGGRLLDGVTVLDLTRILAGPYCTRVLADLGARVIKIERPGTGDDTRANPHQLDPGRADQSSYFVRLNAGKLSVAVDLGHPDGAAVVRDLARAADVLLENFVPGTMARLGLDAPALRAVRPDLVYCSISGYGQTGPWRERPAFAHVIHAVSGLMDLEAGSGRPPAAGYLQAADVLAGAHAASAILAALVRRGRTGEGAQLDVSLLETLVAADDLSYPSLLTGGAAFRGPRGGMLVHRVGEAWIALQLVGLRALWPRLLGLMGRSDLAADARFATPVARRQHWPALAAVVGEWLDGFPDAEAALAALDRARIPCARVLAAEEVLAHPHLAARQAFPAVFHPTAGSVRVTATPLHVDGAPVHPAGPAPYRPGEDTRRVLAGLLGYAPDRIEALVRAGAIGVPEPDGPGR